MSSTHATSQQEQQKQPLLPQSPLRRLHQRSSSSGSGCSLRSFEEENERARKERHLSLYVVCFAAFLSAVQVSSHIIQVLRLVPLPRLL